MVEKTHEKTVALNRRASHDYFLEEKFECGIVLTGTEIKSVISPYKYGNIFNVDETRDRKLLLHKLEIFRLHQKVKLKGYTLIPVRMYLKDGRAKLEIALAKGKDLYDKRETEKLRDAKRAMEKALKLH